MSGKIVSLQKASKEIKNESRKTVRKSQSWVRKMLIGSS